MSKSVTVSKPRVSLEQWLAKGENGRQRQMRAAMEYATSAYLEAGREVAYVVRLLADRGVFLEFVVDAACAKAAIVQARELAQESAQLLSCRLLETALVTAS